MNHAKRAESQMSRRRAHSRAGEDDSVTGDSETAASGEERKAPLDLTLVGGMHTDSPVPSFIQFVKDDLSEDEVVLGDYGPLSDSPDELDSPSESGEEITTRASLAEDPLVDVFGTDQDTWTDLHAQSDHRTSQRQMNPYVVDLALNASELAALPDDRVLADAYDEESVMLGQKEENEVKELLEAMSRPVLAVSIPSSPQLADTKTVSSPSTASTHRKHVLLPLVIPSNNLPRPDSAESEYSPSPVLQNIAESTHLAYRMSGSSAVDESYDEAAGEDEFQRTRTPLDDKRVGGVFDDLDLGLEDSEVNIEVICIRAGCSRMAYGLWRTQFDENDPDDHRKSQFLMKARLDEIEKVRPYRVARFGTT
jgi:hypothetical protein